MVGRSPRHGSACLPVQPTGKKNPPSLSKIAGKENPFSYQTNSVKLELRLHGQQGQNGSGLPKVALFILKAQPSLRQTSSFYINIIFMIDHKRLWARTSASVNQCSSVHLHLTQLRTQFWLSAFKMLFFFSNGICYIRFASQVQARKTQIRGETETYSRGQECRTISVK